MARDSGGYRDLNLSEKFDPKKLAAIKRLGYDTVAFDTRVDESIFEQKKKKKNEPAPVADVVPEPANIPENAPPGLTVLRRLTLEFSDPNVVHKLNQSDNLRKYDILAVVPTSAAAFQHACRTMDVDVISYRPEIALDYKINRKLYNQAVERGVHFELTYAAALKSSVHRKNLIARSHLYHTIGRSANMILCSGAQNEFQARGPNDVINLCLILGMSEQQSKHMLTENTRKVLLKADSRRRGKISIFILKKNNVNKRTSSIEDELEVKKMKISE